jgi:hypothetical protein
MSGISNLPYSPILLSHQTGLSVTATTNTNIGTSITIPRNGIVKITMSGYVSGGTGIVLLNITRGSNTYTLGNPSLFSNNASTGITNTSTQYLLATVSESTSGTINLIYASNPYTLDLPVLEGDIIQFVANNSTSGDSVNITDLVIILQ